MSIQEKEITNISLASIPPEVLYTSLSQPVVLKECPKGMRLLIEKDGNIKVIPVTYGEIPAVTVSLWKRLKRWLRGY